MTFLTDIVHTIMGPGIVQLKDCLLLKANIISSLKPAFFRSRHTLSSVGGGSSGNNSVSLGGSITPRRLLLFRGETAIETRGDEANAHICGCNFRGVYAKIILDNGDINRVTS